MSNLQLEWSETELLETDPVVEPLVAAGRRCHGGFDAQGTYRSPRTRFRLAAIDAWQKHHHEQFDCDLVHAPLDTLRSGHGKVTADTVQGTAAIGWDVVRGLVDTTPLRQVPGLDVSKLQISLRKLGYMDLVTGYYGRITQEAVLQFQQDSGIDATGMYGAITRMALASQSR